MLKASLNSDSVTETTTTGYFTRIKNSLVGILIGIALFIGAFVVLFLNEGRVNLSEIAKTSTHIEATTQAAPNLNSKLVSLTGDLTTEELIGDYIFIKPDKYLLLKRTVEMFAWDEDVNTETKKNTGGSETTTKTYSYYTKWTSSPEKTSNFKKPENHFNPPKSIENYSIQANKGKMGIYTIDVKDLNLPPSRELELQPEFLMLDQPIQPQTGVTSTGVNINNVSQVQTTNPATQDVTPSNNTAPQGINTSNNAVQTTTLNTAKPVISGNYIFNGKGSITNPQIGDLRISYNYIKSGENGTIFGKLEGTSIAKFTNKDGTSILCMRNGDKESAIATLKSEHDTVTWILRVVGFLMMLIGLNLIFAPIGIILDFLPFLGNISRSVTGIITFIASLILSIVTIIISLIIHNIFFIIITAIILIVITIIAVVGGIFIFQKIKKPA